MAVKKYFSVLTILLFIVTLVLFLERATTVAGEEENKRAATLITNSNYKTWLASNLTDAKESVEKFLHSQKQSTDLKRPYKNNNQWTEGSLMALDKAVQSSKLAEANASSDLARMLLIETVHNLEKRTAIQPSEPLVTALNNFANDSGEYELEYQLPTAKELPVEQVKYDVMFLLDWSGSMDEKLEGLAGYPAEGIPANHPRLHAKHLILEFSRLVLEEYVGSRVSLVGMNATIPNGIPIRQVDTGYFGAEPGWEQKIKTAYLKEPTAKEDNIAGNLDVVIPMIEKNRNPEAIPVIIYFTDFQFTPRNKQNQIAMYRNGLTKFNQLRTTNKQGPIYLGVRYDHVGNYGPAPYDEPTWAGGNYNYRPVFPEKGNYDVLQDEVTIKAVPARKGWDWLAINKSNAKVASDSFMNMFKGSVPKSPSKAYSAEFDLQKFKYITSSFKSNENATLATSDNKKIRIKNENNKEIPTLDSGMFRVNFDDPDVYPMGTSSPPASKTNGIKFDAAEYQQYNQTFKTLPNLFHPFTEAAIEVYFYKGSGTTTDAANYQLKNTIVGSNYKLYGGQDYLLKDTGLSSIQYGKSLTKTEALAIVKKQLGADEYNKLNFASTAANQLTAATKQMTFDASKNVYKLYAESNESRLTVEYREEGTKKEIQPAKILPNLIGQPYEIIPSQETITGYTYVRSEGAALKGNYQAAEQTITLIYKRAVSDLTIAFVDKAGKELNKPIVQSKRIGEIVDVTTDITLANLVVDTIRSIESKEYKLITRPADEKNIKIIDGINKVTYVFDGKLLLVSAPQQIDFNVQTYKGKITRVNNPVYDKDLIIKDGRQVKGSWTLTAKLTTEVTHSADSSIVLKNAIRYVYKGKEVTLSNEAKQIVTHVNETNKDLYNVSETWDGSKNGDGFKLEVDPGDVKKAGAYQGEILWELAAVPGNS